MKRKLILITLIASLSLAGCGPIGDARAGNDEVSSVNDEVSDTDNDPDAQDTDEEPADDESQDDEDESSVTDENAEFKYFRADGNNKWYVHYSEPEENFIMLCLEENPQMRIVVEADDSGEYPSAVYTAGESRAYYENMNYDFIKNEVTDFCGFEAIHHISVDFEGNYYEHYFFDIGKGVIVKVSLLCDYNFYRDNRDSADEILKNIEFFGCEPLEKSDEITMKDIVKANRLSNVLSVYDSVRTEIKYGLKKCTLYSDPEFSGICDILNAEGQIGDRICEYDSGEYKTMFTYESSVNLYEDQFFMKGMMDYFLVTDIREKGKKTHVTAEINNDVSRMFLDEFDYEDKDDTKVVLEITLDTDTLFISDLTVKSVSLVLKDELFSMKCDYNADKGLLLKQMYDHMNTDDLRTITALVNPGMKNEYTVSRKGVKGDQIQRVEFGDRVMTGEYEDPEMTKEYNTGTDKDTNADLQFYAREIF